MRRLWVLLVTEGLALKAAPEAYRSRTTCEREAARAALLSKRNEGTPIEEVEPGVHAVGRRRFSVMAGSVQGIRKGDALFVAVVIGSNGNVVLGPVLHRSKGPSRVWVEHFADGKIKTWVKEKPGEETLCRFREKGKTLLAISSAAKVIAPFAALLEAEEGEKVTRAPYELELSVRYTHALFATIESDPGLSREQLESQIDQDFSHIAGYQGTPVDLDWTLESVEERGSHSLKLQDPQE